MGEPNYTGVGVYTENLIKSLAKIDSDNDYYLCYRLSRLKKKWLANPVNQSNFHFKIIQEPLNFLFERKLDIFHGSERLPNYRRPKKIVTIHDMAAVLGGDFMTDDFREMIKDRYGRLVKTADRIITVSENTKRDLCEYYKLAPSLVDVTYQGISEKFRPLPEDTINEVLGRHGLTKPYILNVGALQERKNILRIIEAFGRYMNAGGDANTKLVLCGKPTYAFDRIPKKIAELGLEEKVVILQYMANDDLVALYNGAMMLCFPSLFEGFGLPIVEAFACGCPVITSNITSMPEVAGDAALLVDPLSVEDIESAMRSLTNESERKRLIEKGLERAKVFVWGNIAKKVLDIYKSVVQ